MTEEVKDIRFEGGEQIIEKSSSNVQIEERGLDNNNNEINNDINTANVDQAQNKEINNDDDNIINQDPVEYKEILYPNQNQNNDKIQKVIITLQENKTDRNNKEIIQDDDKLNDLFKIGQTENNIYNIKTNIVNNIVCNPNAIEVNLNTNLNNKTELEQNTSKNKIILKDKKNIDMYNKLKRNENKLKSDLTKLENKESYLANEGFLDLSLIHNNLYKLTNPSYSNISQNEVDKNIREAKLKEIKEKKTKLYNQLNEISFQISNIMSNDYKENTQRGDIIKKYLDNFEYDKEMNNKKLKKIREEYNKRMEKHKRSVDELIRKRNEQYDNKENELFNNKMLERKMFHSQQKEIEKKRSEMVNKKIENLQLNKSITKRYKNYDYILDKEKFENNEKMLIEHENNLRKEKYKPIPIEEINEFEKKVKNNFNKNLLELENRSSKMKELWKERAELLPKYRYPMAQDNITKDIINKESMLIDQQLRKNLKYKMDSEIKKYFLPKIDEKLQKELKERIKKIEDPKGEIKLRRNVSSRHIIKRNKFVLKKIDPSKYKWELKLYTSDDKIKSNSNPQEKNDVQVKEKEKDKNEKKNSKYRDYLEEAIENKKQKELKEPDKNNNPDIINEKFSQKWDKLLEDNTTKANIIDKIDQIKNNAKYYESLADMKKQVLRNSDKKNNNNFKSDFQLGEEISDLYVNSIQAKLKILGTLTKKPE